MNNWSGTGYLVREPKRVQTNGDTSLCLMRVGIERAGRDGGAGYFEVKCFDSLAEACLAHLRKGSRVAIKGRLRFEEFETTGGDYASRVSIVANWVDFLPTGRRRDGDGFELPQVQPAAEPEEVDVAASS
jgi:single-stranded DNA-binding protein